MNRCLIGQYSDFRSRQRSGFAAFAFVLISYSMLLSCSSGLSTVSQPAGGSGSLLQVSRVFTFADNTCVIKSGVPSCSGNDDYNQVYASSSSTTETWEPSLTAMSALTSVSSISGGSGHACVLQSDALNCWGDNSNFQLGVAAPATSTSSLIATIASGVSSFSSGLNHVCAITSSNDLKCWGLNTSGQVGNGTTTNVSTPTTIDAGTSYAQVSAGASHTCAVTVAGALKCWGSNSNGQLGDGTTTDSSSPNALGLSSVALVHVAGNDTCALTTASALYCWGANSSGEFGLGDSTSRLVPTLVQSSVSSFALSHNSAMCFISSGIVKCSGAASYGQIGQDRDANLNTAATVSGLGTGATSIESGNNHFCAISSGYLYCWGLNLKGQLAIGKSGRRYSPKFSAGNLFSKIKASQDSVCGIYNGAISCWGTKEVQGRSNNLSPSPVSVSASSNTDFAVGSKFGCAVQNGYLNCWGVNANLGINSTVPTWKIAGSVTAVAAGSNHVCAVVSNALKCWGDNTYGQLGDGTTTSTTTVVTAVSSGVTAVFAGYNNTCAVISNSLKCWGDNAHYQLATTSGAISSSPVTVFSTQYEAAIGDGHICASFGGILKCWGRNSDGQVGNGSSGTDVSTPYTITNSGLSYLALSAKTTYANISGNLYGFGYNSGMLGDGTLTARTSPTLISSGAKDVHATKYDVCAEFGFSSFCWGFSTGAMADGSEWITSSKNITN